MRIKSCQPPSPDFFQAAPPLSARPKSPARRPNSLRRHLQFGSRPSAFPPPGGPCRLSLNPQPSTLNQFRVSLWSRSPVVLWSPPLTTKDAPIPAFCFPLSVLSGCTVVVLVVFILVPVPSPFTALCQRGARAWRPLKSTPTRRPIGRCRRHPRFCGERAKSPKQIKKHEHDKSIWHTFSTW
jgi:hypothetical protein